MTVDYRSHPILYVDDEASNLIALRYALEDQFTVITTQQPEEALRILATQEIAVLLADQRMPGMSGAQVCARAREIRPDTVRIILTAYADIHAAIDAINRGQVTRYLAKPFRNDELVEVMRTAIDLVHLQRTVQDLEVRLLRVGPAQAVHTAHAEIAHELNNPLGAIEAGLRQAADLVQAALPHVPEGHDARRFLVAAVEAFGDAQTGVDQLLGMVQRLRRGLPRQQVGPRPRCDAARAADNTVRLLRKELERHARVQVVLDADPTIPLEASAVGQVLINLLLNAAQAIASRPPQPGQGEIAVRVESDGKEARIAVTDDGPGIPPELRERIFDPHFTTKSEGSGLGLSIAQRLVTEAGGRLECVSTEGKGTTFTVYLPVVSPS
jgi:signal transduction histidine kinase